MRKIFLASIGILFTLFIYDVTYAQEKDISSYVSLGIGYSIPNTQTDNDNDQFEFKKGIVTKGSVGYVFKTSSLINFRSELEISYRRYEADNSPEGGISHELDGNITYLTGMINGLLDFKTGTKWSPFAGVGIGLSQVSWNSIKFKDGTTSPVDDSDNVFAYQGIVGLAYDVAESWKIDLEYRYFHANDTTLTGDNGAKASLNSNTNHSVIIGTRYSF